MSDKAEFELCRLCLNSRGLLINVFGENSKLRIMLETTIEDLIDIKVVEDANYPWFVCSNCMEKLTEFRLFKRRCAECFLAFSNRIHKECNPTMKDWISNGEEFSGKIKKEIDDNVITSDNVDVQHDMIIVKEEIDAASGCSVSPLKHVDLSMVSSMQEGCSYWSDNKEAGNVDYLKVIKLHSYSDEGVDNKGVYHTDIPQEEGLRGEVLQSQDEFQGQDDTGNNLFHTCQICSKAFITRDILEAHVMNVHHEKGIQFRCDVCSASFQCKSDLHRHVTLLHTVKPVHSVNLNHHCQYCSRQFRDMTELRIHMSEHGGERSFKCTICSKTFTQKSNLKKHLLTHTGERSYKCEICSKAFTQKSHMTRHILTHSGERLFECSTCSKAFSRSSHLKNHMLTHTGEKSYKCSICMKAFTQNAHLKRHLRTHS